MFDACIKKVAKLMISSVNGEWVEGFLGIEIICSQGTLHYLHNQQLVAV